MWAKHSYGALTFIVPKALYTGSMWGTVGQRVRKLGAALPNRFVVFLFLASTWLSLQVGIQQRWGGVGTLVFALVVSVGGASVIKYAWLRLRVGRHDRRHPP